MSERWRVIDTGLRPAAQNIALNRALLEARAAEEIPSTLRFSRSARSALLGHQQSAAQELNLDHCGAHGIAIQRRISDGGAVYCDETSLGWELYLHRRDVGAADMRAVAKRICHAAAAAVSALGVDARYRPRHEIEVDGRKVSDAGGAFDGDALLYQGVLTVDSDFDEMLRVLRAPLNDPSGNAIALARERVTSLRDLLGRRPGHALLKRYFTEAFESEFAVEIHEGDLTLTEHRRFQTALAEIDNPGWIHLVLRPVSDAPGYEAAQEFPGGVLRAHVIYDRLTQRIKQVWFAGGLRVSPRRTIADLEAVLRETAVDRLERNVDAFFAGRAVDMRPLVPADFIAVTRRALKLPLVAQNP